ncbi:Sec-independent protein translocase protein TatB [Nisaea denitrificans]|uniref:Sec-independent protein translocase protein TatB n=1 Tax=Nisaea denitrificans TaxID=390877 RepID=UPI000416C389|nr:Sec-independent protein translocase protein TatB [Nisaea denitrificans]|tara:strand:- start:14579 stop:15037 length:459 start_codon:yes stop_codon:yes gene_type:complete
MFDLGWQEFMLIAFVAVVIVGPRDLPRVVRSVSTYLRKARSIARDFQNSLEEVAREAELDDLRKEAKNFTSGDIEKRVNELVDPGGDTKKEMERIAGQARDVASSRPVESAPDEIEAESIQDAKAPGAAEPAEAKPSEPDDKSAQKSAAAGQ